MTLEEELSQVIEKHERSELPEEDKMSRCLAEALFVIARRIDVLDAGFAKNCSKLAMAVLELQLKTARTP